MVAYAFLFYIVFIFITSYVCIFFVSFSTLARNLTWYCGWARVSGMMSHNHVVWLFQVEAIIRLDAGVRFLDGPPSVNRNLIKSNAKSLVKFAIHTTGLPIATHGHIAEEEETSDQKYEFKVRFHHFHYFSLFFLKKTFHFCSVVRLIFEIYGRPIFWLCAAGRNRVKLGSHCCQDNRCKLSGLFKWRNVGNNSDLWMEAPDLTLLVRRQRLCDLVINSGAHFRSRRALMSVRRRRAESGISFIRTEKKIFPGEKIRG